MCYLNKFVIARYSEGSFIRKMKSGLIIRLATFIIYRIVAGSFCFLANLGWQRSLFSLLWLARFAFTANRGWQHLLFTVLWLARFVFYLYLYSVDFFQTGPLCSRPVKLLHVSSGCLYSGSPWFQPQPSCKRPAH